MHRNPSNRLFSTLAALCLSGALIAPAVGQTTRRAREERPASAPAKPMEGKTVQKAEPLGTITFKASHATHNNEGTFKKWRFVEINKPPAGVVGGSAKIEIDVTSLSAKPQGEKEENDKLTGHLKSPDFFTAENFPKAIIAIQAIKAAAPAAGAEAKPNQYTAEGELDLHGVKSPLAFNFEVVSENPLKIKGTAKVDRDKHKVGQPYEEGNPRSIQKEVDIEFETLVPDMILPVVEVSGEEMQKKTEGMKAGIKGAVEDVKKEVAPAKPANP